MKFRRVAATDPLPDSLATGSRYEEIGAVRDARNRGVDASARHDDS
jgi:hypothetical protein